ncbi:hypothetical protein GIB67_002336 [Kingdonia uniflora]|uniref:Large ribosomal subunit protein bL28m n=1 Tax=Kingdonia uniflora TaxID=39325 RepID=A0A7J7LIJ3_9MAGN|nr:hypothetical protein GIB67_023383 [Kingdonia uniflora]KAF6173712.1 hypothetical protein GIB67_002336 [Kingdonia uniflora]
MAFRSKEVLRKIVRDVGKENLVPLVKEVAKKYPSKIKVVMGSAKRGIFAGRHIQFGDQISENGGNRSKRSWKPNIQDKRLFSYIHNDHIRLKVSTHALRCIDKVGGIDEYLLKTPYQKMESETGLLWKTKIQKMYGKLEEMEAAGIPTKNGAKLVKKKTRKEAKGKVDQDLANKQIKEGKIDV